MEFLGVKLCFVWQVEFPGLKRKPKNFRGFSKKYVLNSPCLVFSGPFSYEE